MHLLASEANDMCLKQNRKVIGEKQVLDAIEVIGIIFL